jgi:hypothetical protein
MKFLSCESIEVYHIAATLTVLLALALETQQVLLQTLVSTT